MSEEIHILDLDGTLIDSNDFVYLQQAECLSHLYMMPQDELFLRIKSKGINHVLSQIGMTTEEFYRQEYIPWDPIEMARIGRLKYFDDALEYFEQSEAIKYVVTNSSSMMTKKKDLALGISNYVDGILSASELGEAKPKTYMGERVIYLLDKRLINNIRMTVIGDSEVDVMFGLNMKRLYPNTTLLIDRSNSYNGIKPDRTIKSLTDII